jgi:benzoyl-CoA-dihydrodiol lyase
MIDFRTHPDRYRHWRLSVDGSVATLALAVAEDGGLRPGYSLKLNSYDLGVDIELYDAVQRLRFEHPEVGAVVLTSGLDRVFCAGANIGMLAGASHGEKVNFCKFTNETRLGIEDASGYSGLKWICAINGTAAGGGYELALAADWIVMADDGSTAVSLPELPLLAVLPGTGGLTRLVDKRGVRRDRADVFCTTEEGVRGRRAVDWRLVDAVVPRSRLMETAYEKARDLAAQGGAKDSRRIELKTLERDIAENSIDYGVLRVEMDRDGGVATITVRAPEGDLPKDVAGIHAQGCDFWPLALARALDDTILHLRTNEPRLGVWILASEGDTDAVVAADTLLIDHTDDRLVRETRLYLKRVFKRLDVSSRSLIARIESGSCFAGTLFELVLAADRSYMLDGALEGDNRPPATIRLTAMNCGVLPMGNGLSRLAARFLDDAEGQAAAEAAMGRDLDAAEAEALGLVTFIPDDLDWEEELRIAVEERASFSPDALSGMEANLRFAGPETMETKIFARLSAWQNWIFQRPDAVGPDGALKLYGSGKRPNYSKERV